MNSRNLLLLSTSTIYGSGFLDYCIEDVKSHFEGINSILFIPYARPSGITHEEYTDLVRERLFKIDIQVKGINEFNNQQKALDEFGGIYIGGGNTFLLLRELYAQNLMGGIREKVNSGAMRYMGSSAGTNVACMTINNTNDMPIVYPPSFEALELAPFNINPHYIDPDPESKHKGETRETRINEFHTQGNIPVVGLREGSYLKIEKDDIQLFGNHSARIFRSGQSPEEIKSGQNLKFLLTDQ